MVWFYLVTKNDLLQRAPVMCPRERQLLEYWVTREPPLLVKARAPTSHLSLPPPVWVPLMASELLELSRSPQSCCLALPLGNPGSSMQTCCFLPSLRASSAAAHLSDQVSSTQGYSLSPIQSHTHKHPSECWPLLRIDNI